MYLASSYSYLAFSLFKILKALKPGEGYSSRKNYRQMKIVGSVAKSISAILNIQVDSRRSAEVISAQCFIAFVKLKARRNDA